MFTHANTTLAALYCPTGQFRALSTECCGDQSWHLHVRSAVMDYIEAHADDYSFYFAEGEFADYCRKMRMARTWGDELTLRAAAELLQVRILVITSEEENYLLHYDPTSGDGSTVRTLFITYVSPIHYNTLRPKSSEDSDKLGSAVLGSQLRRHQSEDEDTSEGGRRQG